MSGNRLGVIGGHFVINRIKVARWAVVGGVILTVGVAAGAASRMKRASAGDACLCTPDTQDAAALGVTARAAAAPAASYAKGIGIVPSSARTGPTGALAPFVAASGPAFWNVRAAAVSHGNAGGVGWGSRTGGVGAYSGSSSHRVGALGGLWRFMNFARHATPAATHAAVSPKAESPRKPNRGPSNGNGSSRPAPGGGGGAAAAPPPIAAAPVDPPLFGGPGPSIGDPIGGDPIPIPGIGIGGGGGGGATGPALATTPEPGSIFLLGTGVLGLFGMLRRRTLQ